MNVCRRRRRISVFLMLAGLMTCLVVGIVLRSIPYSSSCDCIIRRWVTLAHKTHTNSQQRRVILSCCSLFPLLYVNCQSGWTCLNLIEELIQDTQHGLLKYHLGCTCVIHTAIIFRCVTVVSFGIFSLNPGREDWLVCTALTT